MEQSITDKLERLVNIEKVATEAVLNGQLLFKERMEQDLELKLNDLKTEASVDIHNAINEALEDVDVSIIHFYLTEMKEKTNTRTWIGSYKRNI